MSHRCNSSDPIVITHAANGNGVRASTVRRIVLDRFRSSTLRSVDQFACFFHSEEVSTPDRTARSPSHITAPSSPRRSAIRTLPGKGLIGGLYAFPPDPKRVWRSLRESRVEHRHVSRPTSTRPWGIDKAVGAASRRRGRGAGSSFLGQGGKSLRINQLVETPIPPAIYEL
jgi:hypothetical protein